MATLIKSRTSLRRPSASSSPKMNRSVVALKAVGEAVKKSIIGRAEVIDAAILAIAARQNILLLGVPGTAKTRLVSLIASAFSGPGEVFETLLTKFSKPHEVFGPTDIAALEKGIVRVLTNGYLPNAIVGVLDEIFKASSAILNSLLTIANERRFKNGSTWQACPTRLLVGMSNEYPEEPAILAAFFDRFPIKLEVGYLDEGDFSAMLDVVANPANAPAIPTLPSGALDEIDALVDACVFPSEIVELLGKIRGALRLRNVTISDRRWAQAVRLMRANAVLAGRDEVKPTDTSVLAFVAWNDPKERPVVSEVLGQFGSRVEAEVKQVLDIVAQEKVETMQALNVAYAGRSIDTTRPSPDNTTGARRATQALTKVRTVSSQLDMIDVEDGDTNAEELIAEAREQIRVVEAAVIALAKGKNVLEAINALQKD